MPDSSVIETRYSSATTTPPSDLSLVASDRLPEIAPEVAILPDFLEFGPILCRTKAKPLTEADVAEYVVKVVTNVYLQHIVFEVFMN